MHVLAIFILAAQYTLFSYVFSAVLSLLTEKRCVRLMPQYCCVWETPPSLLLYKIQLFSLIEVHLRVCVALFFVFWS